MVRISAHNGLLVAGEVHVQVQSLSLLLPLSTHQLQVNIPRHVLPQARTNTTDAY